MDNDSEDDHFEQLKDLSNVVGPHGIGYAIKGSRVRRLCWAFVLSLGCIGTVVIMWYCTQQYFNYPSIIKLKIDGKQPVRLFFTANLIFEERDHSWEFPRIIFCLNSLHSKKKLANNIKDIFGLLYNSIVINPTLVDKIANLPDTGKLWEPILAGMASGNSTMDITMQTHQYNAYYAVVKNYAYMKRTTMQKLYENTNADWRILACRAGTTDCSVDGTWEDKLYQVHGLKMII